MKKMEQFCLVDRTAVHARANQIFLTYARRLRRALPHGTDISHVGATAIQHCVTKGDLDIAIHVQPMDFERAEIALKRMFRCNTGSYKSPDFAAFETTHCGMSLGLQLTVRNGPIDVFTTFRDKLLSNRGLVEKYNRL